jgi:hypothetical protein
MAVAFRLRCSNPKDVPKSAGSDMSQSAKSQNKHPQRLNHCGCFVLNRFPDEIEYCFGSGAAPTADAVAPERSEFVSVQFGIPSRAWRGRRHSERSPGKMG